MDKNKIIYIAGLGHSGSTLLDMLLGSHSNIVGLGEITPFLKRKDREIDDKSTCSCGKLGSECDFWSNIDKIIKNEVNTTNSYLKLSDFFFKKYGNNKILVDSSKNSYSYLQEINKKYDLKILFLTRDFRSWTFSRHANKGGLTSIWALRWFAEIKKLEYQFKKMNLDFFKVGYEELALYPEFILKRICNFIDIDFQENMLNPNNTKSHIINGNLLRADKEKRSSIKYDGRWLTSGRIMRLSGILPFNIFNKKRVYSNVLEKNLKADNFYLFSSKRRKKLNEIYN